MVGQNLQELIQRSCLNLIFNPSFLIFHFIQKSPLAPNAEEQRVLCLFQ